MLFQIRQIMKGRIFMKKTRILSFLYCVCLVIGLLVICVTAASPEGDFTFDAATGTITGYKGSGGDVEIPAIIGGIDVVAIGERAFDDCTNLTNINIPDSVTTIGNFAFGWTGLTSIIIPDGVTTIGQGAFVWTGLTSIIIPESVTIIGIQAFAGCTGLTSINVQSGNTIYKSEGNCIIELATNKLISGCKTSVIPNYVTYIGNNAFEQCSVLTSITIPDNVTTIGNSAFYGCTGLTNIIIPDSVIAIKQNAFANCTGLTNIILSDKVTTIGTGVFSSCISLTSITIPESVTIIGIQAFSGCTGLTSINVQPGNTIYKSEGNCLIEIATNKLISGCKTSVIPNYVTYIEYAFSGCIGLTSIIIPESVTTIGAVAFNGCSGLSSIIIPDKVTTIGNSAFARCTGLTNIIIPDSVTSIGAVTFYECSSLTSIIIPDNVTTIGNNAFGQCIGLSSITFTSPTTTIYDGENTIPTATKIIGYNSSTAKDYAVKYSRTFVVIASPENDFTFNPSTGTITGYTGPGGDVVIPATIGGTNVVAIGDNTFSECDNLTSIIIQDSVTVIGNYAFYHCNGLTSIVIPDSVTTIGSYAFQYCSGLISISIPDSVTTIGQQALCSCFGLISITVQPGNTVYKSEGNCLIEIATNTLIAGCKTSVIPDYIAYIGYGAFTGCLELTNIIIPNSVTTIGWVAFSDCVALTSITIPSSVTAIGMGAFYNCTGLTSIYIPASVTYIENNAFHYCKRLTIYGVKDSYVETYAKDNKYTFIAISSTPVITTNPTASDITYGQTLANSTLTGGIASVDGIFTWTNDSIAPAVINSDTTLYSVTFTPNDTVNYDSTTTDITLTVNKANPAYTTPTGLNALYGQTLADVSLPTAANGTFTWEDAITTSVGNVGINYFNVTFTPTDTANYNTINKIEVSVDVGKVTPAITTNPTASDITYGQTLAASNLSGGLASVNGIFSWTDDSITPAVINSDTTLYSVTFTPNDTVNYENVTTEISVIVNKASPTIILEDYNAVYTRNIIKINGATVTLANDEIYNGNITYIYYTDKDCTKLTRKTHGAIIEGSAPRNIGSYFVKASIDETDNYTAATSNIAKLTISMFKPVTYYTIIATSDIGGSLSPSEASVRQNSSKTFIITPDKGYKISDVLIDGVSIGIVKQYTFINVTGNHTIHAEFIPITTYNITTNASEGGRITPQSKVVNEGDNITIRIMPEKGYKINDVIIDGISVGARPVYTFRNITQNHVVTVTFEKR